MHLELSFRGLRSRNRAHVHKGSRDGAGVFNADSRVVVVWISRTTLWLRRSGESAVFVALESHPTGARTSKYVRACRVPAKSQPRKSSSRKEYGVGGLYTSIRGCNCDRK